jgi:hypothetical protein
MSIQHLSGRDLREHIRINGIDYHEAISRIRHAGLTMEDVKIIAEKAVPSKGHITLPTENPHAH